MDANDELNVRVEKVFRHIKGWIPTTAETFALIRSTAKEGCEKRAIGKEREADFCDNLCRLLITYFFTVCQPTLVMLEAFFGEDKSILTGRVDDTLLMKWLKRTAGENEEILLAFATYLESSWQVQLWATGALMYQSKHQYWPEMTDMSHIIIALAGHRMIRPQVTLPEEAEEETRALLEMAIKSLLVRANLVPSNIWLDVLFALHSYGDEELQDLFLLGKQGLLPLAGVLPLAVAVEAAVLLPRLAPVLWQNKLNHCSLHLDCDDLEKLASIEAIKTEVKFVLANRVSRRDILGKMITSELA